jgi:hypothetical protein
MQTSLLRGLPASVLLKRMPLLLGCAVVPFAIIAAVVQPAEGGGGHSANARGQPHPPPSAPTKAPMPVDVPRGNLRNDIARNVQSRPELANPPAAPRPRTVHDQH